jgi:hypothetical protein
MMTEQNKRAGLPNLPAPLKPQDRLELEMLVLDEDAADAQGFLARFGAEILERDEALAICRKWLKKIRAGERGKLQIRYTDKGPTLDMS